MRRSAPRRGRRCARIQNVFFVWQQVVAARCAASALQKIGAFCIIGGVLRHRVTGLYLVLPSSLHYSGPVPSARPPRPGSVGRGARGSKKAHITCATTAAGAAQHCAALHGYDDGSNLLVSPAVAYYITISGFCQVPFCFSFKTDMIYSVNMARSHHRIGASLSKLKTVSAYA